MPRRPSAESILKNFKKQVEFRTPIAAEIYLPNHSGDHSKGRVRTTPTTDLEIVNKKYVDDNLHSAITVADSSTINFTLNGQEITAITIDSAIVHDNLSGFVGNEHIDWTGTNAGTIHASNYVDNDTTDHTALSNIGTNTHTQIDTHISNEPAAAITTHAAIANAHHEKYTDAEVDTIVATHTALPSAHHTKYTDAEVDAIVATHTALGDAHHAEAHTIASHSDYEEGTWTPSIADNDLDGTGEGQAYNLQAGTYTKIGRLVNAKCRVRITDLGTLTAGEGVNIMGLPFTSLSTASSHSSCTIGFATSLALANSGESVTGFVGNNTSHVDLRHWSSTAGVSTLSVAELSVGAEIMMSITYFV